MATTYEDLVLALKLSPPSAWFKLLKLDSTKITLFQRLLTELKTNDAAGSAATAALLLRVAALEGLDLGEKANAAAMVALDVIADVIKDGAICHLADTGKSYYYNLGEATGSQDPPFTYDGTRGVWHEGIGRAPYFHDPVADTTAAKAMAGVDLVNNMLVPVISASDTKFRVYRYNSAGVAPESLPEVISVTAGGTLTDIVVDLGGVLVASHESTYAHANLPTADEKAALVGTSGTAPTAANPLVDNADTRLADARTPTAHTHAGGEITSPVANATDADTVDGQHAAAFAAAAHGHVSADISDFAASVETNNNRSKGSIGVAMLGVSVGGNFTPALDTVTIGGDVWAAIAGVPGAGTKEFQVGADRDASLANLAAKINDVTRGTELVLAATAGPGAMVIVFADAVGGTPVVGTPTSMVLAVSITGPSTATWDKANINESGNASSTKSASDVVTISVPAAARIAASDVVALGYLPFTATAKSALHVTALRAGVLVPCDDVFGFNAPEYTAVIVTGAAGVAPLLAGDVVYWSVIGG